MVFSCDEFQWTYHLSCPSFFFVEIKFIYLVRIRSSTKFFNVIIFRVGTTIHQVNWKIFAEHKMFYEPHKNPIS